LHSYQKVARGSECPFDVRTGAVDTSTAPELYVVLKDAEARRV
jgi:hypothetical protein